MPLERRDGPLHPLAGDVAADARVEQALAVGLAGAEDDRVADQDSGEAGEDHQRQRSIARREKAARDQRHVLGQRNAETTGDQDRQNADVERRPVEIPEEMEEPAFQSVLPDETIVLA